MPNACLYARFSPRPGAEQCDSVEKQLERCKLFAGGQGYDVVGEFFDKDLSGGRADNRPGLLDAIASASKHKAVLVVYSLDRLARNTRDAIDILNQLRKAGADLASISESLNTKSAIGIFLFELLASFAQLQRRQIQERTSMAMNAYQKNGRRMTRMDRIPYGKMADPADPANIIDCIEEIDIVKRAQELRSTGIGWRGCCSALHAEGRAFRGGVWHPQTLRRILARFPAVSKSNTSHGAA